MREVRKAFFSEEKNQKTFMFSPAARLRLGGKLGAAQKVKVFCFFSSEKKILAFFLLVICASFPLQAEQAPKRGPVAANDIFAVLTRPDHPAELDALRALRDALDGSPDPQRLAAARAQLDQVLATEERHQGDMPPALVMSGIASRIDAAIAGLEAARRLPPPPQEVLPRFVVPGLVAVSVAFGVALVACLAGLAARGRQSEETEELRETLKKIRRRLEGGGAAAGAGSGLAQELAEVASGEASEAVRQASVAVDRLGAAARDAEGRLEASVGAAEARLHAAASMAGQLEQWVEALPGRLTEMLQAMEARGLEAVEDAALRVESGVAPLAEIGILMADYAGAASGLTAQAEDAAQALQGVIAGLEDRLDDVAGAVPGRIAASLQPVLGELSGGADLLGELSNLSIGQAAKLEDLIARADKVAYDLPAVGQLLEAASAHLLQQMGQDAASGAAVKEAAEALSARLEASAKDLCESLAGNLGELADAMGARLSEGADAMRTRLETHAEAVSESLAGRLWQTADSVGARLAGRAELFQAGLEAGAGAIVDAAHALPAIKDGLREVAVHLARETSAQAGTLTQVAKTLAAETAALLSATRSRAESGAQETAGAQHLPSLVERVGALTGQLEAVLASAETAQLDSEAADEHLRAQEADQMASLLDALAGRAEACLSALPAEVAALAATAAQLRGDAAELGAAVAAGFVASAHEAEATIRSALELLGLALEKLPSQVPEAISPPDPSAREVKALIDLLTERQAEWLGRVEQLASSLPSPTADMDRGLGAAEQEVVAGIAVQSERLAALLDRAETLAALAPAIVSADPVARELEARLAGQGERIAGLLERNEQIGERLAEAAEALTDAPARQAAGAYVEQSAQIASKELEAATETVQRAVQRLLESAAAQEAALSRASQAASDVARLAAAPETYAAADRIGLAGLNGLASLAECLQGEAESLAASVLRGETVRLPAELVSQTPVMLAAIETSIHRLRGTATALALASDAQRKAA